MAIVAENISLPPHKNKGESFVLPSTRLMLVYFPIRAHDNRPHLSRAVIGGNMCLDCAECIFTIQISTRLLHLLSVLTARIAQQAVSSIQ
jgi:hypothetical protein